MLSAMYNYGLMLWETDNAMEETPVQLVASIEKAAVDTLHCIGIHLMTLPKWK